MYAPQILNYRKDLFEMKTTRLFTGKIPQHVTATYDLEGVQCGSTILYCLLRINWIWTSFPAAYPECLAPEDLLATSFVQQGYTCYKLLDQFTPQQPKYPEKLCCNPTVVEIRETKLSKVERRECSSDFLCGETAMVITYPSFFNKMPCRPIR
jgi:hypothetical protein